MKDIEKKDFEDKVISFKQEAEVEIKKLLEKYGLEMKIFKETFEDDFNPAETNTFAEISGFHHRTLIKII